MPPAPDSAPVLCDSRGLAVKEVVATLGPRVLAVGRDNRHFLLGMVAPGSVMPEWQDWDPHFLELCPLFPLPSYCIEQGLAHNKILIYLAKYRIPPGMAFPPRSPSLPHIFMIPNRNTSPSVWGSMIYINSRPLGSEPPCFQQAKIRLTIELSCRCLSRLRILGLARAMLHRHDAFETLPRIIEPVGHSILEGA